MYSISNNNLSVFHNAGFFSCCTLRLSAIIEYFNRIKETPKTVDSSSQFNWYKLDESEDLSSQLFLTKEIDIPYSKDIYPLWGRELDLQFSPYKDLDFESYNPLMEKYFKLNSIPSDVMDSFIGKYKIDYNNTCAVFYRHGDKIRETMIAPVEEFIARAKEIKEQNPNIKFLLLPDIIECQEAFLKEFPNDVIIIEENIVVPNSPLFCAPLTNLTTEQRRQHPYYYLASVYIASQCKHLIVHSGNGGLFSALYRKNSNNIMQYLNGHWIYS